MTQFQQPDRGIRNFSFWRTSNKVDERLRARAKRRAESEIYRDWEDENPDLLRNMINKKKNEMAPPTDEELCDRARIWAEYDFGENDYLMEDLVEEEKRKLAPPSEEWKRIYAENLARHEYWNQWERENPGVLRSLMEEEKKKLSQHR